MILQNRDFSVSMNNLDHGFYPMLQSTISGSSRIFL